MNGTECILEHIRADADARVAAILADAQKECDQITAGARKQGEEIREALIEAAKEAAKAQHFSEERIAQMAGRKTILAEKQALIGMVFEAVEKRLVELTADDAVEFLANMVADASTTGEEAILLNQKDKAIFGESLVSTANAKLCGRGKPCHLVLAAEEGTFSGGFMLLNGDITVNCTYTLLLKTRRDELSAMIVSALFD